MEAIPPYTLADIAKRMDRTVQLGETSVRSLNSRINQSLTLFQESIYQLNQLNVLEYAKEIFQIQPKILLL